MSCPFKHQEINLQRTPAIVEEPLKTKIIVVAFFGQSLEKDGVVIRPLDHWDLQDMKEQCGRRLNIPAYERIEFCNEEGAKIDSFTSLIQGSVAYIKGNEACHRKIPVPPTSIFLGTIPQLMPDFPKSMKDYFEEYDSPILEIYYLSTKVISTNHPSIAELFAQESEYFTKKVAQPFEEVKEIGGDGLFTTSSDEKVWKLAHKLLVPAFSSTSMKAYTQEMGQLALKMVGVLNEFETDEPFVVTDWMTRITFETIGKVGFGYDFGLVESKDCPLHPFIDAMAFCMGQLDPRTSRSKYWKKLPIWSNFKFDENMAYMRSVVDEVVTQRKKAPVEDGSLSDLLGFMLEARDKSTGEKLSDDLIRDQVVTFLIAGHETTSNTLSWCLYLLARHPVILHKVLQEIVNAGITGEEPPTGAQVSKLKYLGQVLKETLRMYPPVSSVQKYCTKDCVLPFGYRVEKDTVVEISIYPLHYNAGIWPEPEIFNPDRFSAAEEANRSPYAWLPFSSGPRACIGMQFALQEAKIILAVLLMKFEFHLKDDKPVYYDLAAPTLKPENLFMTVTPRTELPETTTHSPAETYTPKTELTTPLIARQLSSSTKLPKLIVLFGSDMGLSEEYANKLAKDASDLGFKDTQVLPMDEWEVLGSGSYQEDEAQDDSEKPVLFIITSTYNGLPPDNAREFDKFISAKREASVKPLNGLRYAVFGCGNKQWRTYQAFPSKVNGALARLGADQIFPIGAGNADGDIDADFAQWIAQMCVSLLGDLGMEGSGLNQLTSISTQDPTTGVSLKYLSPENHDEARLARNNINQSPQARVVTNSELQNFEKSRRSTRHIEIELPEDATYNAGDHLEILPANDADLVEAVALSFGYALDAVFEVDIDRSKSKNLSPRSLAAVIKGPCTVKNALMHYADLSAAPSRHFIEVCVSAISAEHPELEKAYLEEICQIGEEGNRSYASFIEENRNLLQLLQNYPMIRRLDFLAFLCGIPVMAKRRYSIASSPYVSKNVAHLCVGVVEETGSDNVVHKGLCSNFLARAERGMPLYASIKPAKEVFHLPEDPTIPVIMVCAGTGIAPFRGFLQERQYHRFKSVKNGGQSTTHLFFGCRSPEYDLIYKEELEAFVADGTLDELHLTFSRVGNVKKYVQHELLSSASMVWDLIHNQKGSLYVCGSASGMAKDVVLTLTSIIIQIGGIGPQEAAEYFQALQRAGRFNEDVWG
ncbi:cytochrome P450 [Basidiobolus meristosporus CBS 931.73]|uniref:NADPH--hemoprotein reductase n=1 Tax=Basidiobolus meristosporus CBS 931.73 TaxID=1314790 RepID=A0A1Y1X9X2_9FUNG|nr:cytochrome P450 [Basidiobolus meristosporus CBS 931.73]|eukprot:ORX82529.1 cytochrome P450 [Basidiobolus meristosporus CBS 931.73]